MRKRPQATCGSTRRAICQSAQAQRHRGADLSSAAGAVDRDAARSPPAAMPRSSRRSGSRWASLTSGGTTLLRATGGTVERRQPDLGRPGHRARRVGRSDLARRADVRRPRCDRRARCGPDRRATLPSPPPTRPARSPCAAPAARLRATGAVNGGEHRADRERRGAGRRQSARGGHARGRCRRHVHAGGLARGTAISVTSADIALGATARARRARATTTT